MRDPILSTMFVVAVEVGLAHLAALRGIEYVRRVAWLQVVLAVLVASHVPPSTFYGIQLIGVYMSVVIGLVIADVELHLSGKREVMLVSARDSISVMLSAVFLISLVIPAGVGQSTAFYVGGALAIMYGCLYGLYHYFKPAGRIKRTIVAVLVGNTSIIGVGAALGLFDGYRTVLDFLMHVGTSLLVFVAVHMRAPEYYRSPEVARLSAPKFTRK